MQDNERTRGGKSENVGILCGFVILKVIFVQALN